jgi:thiol-disulfide isomerase/thioredoxin
MRLIKCVTFLASIFILTGCLEDLNPESKDLQDTQNKIADNFIATTSLNQSISLEDELLANDAVVLYFTMWCSLCDMHMDHMRSDIMNEYPNVRFLMVDYVSGSISQSYSSQSNSGYKDLAVLADYQQSLLNLYDATMASVIVIDDKNTILLNEDYKNGARLIETLENL